MQTTSTIENSMSIDNSTKPVGPFLFCALGALAMSFGWGFRGDYGHEAGAMVAGGLLGMAVCLASGREDWYRRTAVTGMLGAIGWGFGGAMSYGMIPSYTVSDSFPDVYYGYGCLFLVGAIWGGIGGGILSLALTEPRAKLQQFVWPIILLKIVWLMLLYAYQLFPDYQIFYATIETMDLVSDTRATTVLAALIVLSGCWLALPRTRDACGLMLLLTLGWWLGHLLLAKLTGFHMQPKPGGEHRSNAWAGCAGMLVVLIGYLSYHKNRAGIILALYGMLAGGLGFSIGNFVNIPDKVRWEPFWRHEFLRGFDHWKWTEQTFGLIMGLVVSLGVYRLLGGGLLIGSGTDKLAADALSTEKAGQAVHDDPSQQSEPRGIRLNELAAFTILVMLPWSNLFKNVINWTKYKKLTTDLLLGVEPWQWILVLGLMMAGLVIFALSRHRQNRFPLAPRSPLGKGAMLFLFLLWVTTIGALLQAFPLPGKGGLFVHWSFWFTSLLCTALVFRLSGEKAKVTSEATASDSRWRVGLGFWGVCLLIPVLISALSWATMQMQVEKHNGSRLRFGPDAWHLNAKK